MIRPCVEDAQWDRLPIGVRRRLASMTVGQVLQSAAAAAAAGGFDVSAAHVDRIVLELDEQGWDELSEMLKRARSTRRRGSRSAATSGARAASPAPCGASELAILHFARDAAD